MCISHHSQYSSFVYFCVAYAPRTIIQSRILHFVVRSSFFFWSRLKNQKYKHCIMLCMLMVECITTIYIVVDGIKTIVYFWLNSCSPDPFFHRFSLSHWHNVGSLNLSFTFTLLRFCLVFVPFTFAPFQLKNMEYSSFSTIFILLFPLLFHLKQGTSNNFIVCDYKMFIDFSIRKMGRRCIGYFIMVFELRTKNIKFPVAGIGIRHVFWMKNSVFIFILFNGIQASASEKGSNFHLSDCFILHNNNFESSNVVVIYR